MITEQFGQNNAVTSIKCTLVGVLLEGKKILIFTCLVQFLEGVRRGANEQSR